MRQYSKTSSLVVLTGLIGFSFLIFIGVSVNSINLQGSNSKNLSKYSFSLHDNMKNLDEAFVKVPIAKFMSGKPYILSQDDVQIIDYIWDNDLIESPSKNEYNLQNPEDDPSSGQGQYIRKLLKNLTNRFFVECGALDGETRSNTLFMEKNLNWRGLLVEADPSNFAMLTKKNRKAWISNTCLSIKPYPHTAIFHKSWSIGRIVNTGETRMSDKDASVQCMPLFSLLAAINVTTVDYFSLDVEGSELQVLKTIPFDKVFIRTLSVEIAHTKEGRYALLKFMESQGYKMHGKVKVLKPGKTIESQGYKMHEKKKMQTLGKFADDFIFVHKDADI